jgi:hypothetical protein
MSTLEADPNMAYVKGGLFKKLGVDLPSPSLQIYWRSSEAWERGIIEGVQLIE